MRDRTCDRYNGIGMDGALSDTLVYVTLPGWSA